MPRKLYQKECPFCHITFATNDKRSKFCSQSCSAKHSNTGRTVSDYQKMKTSLALAGIKRPERSITRPPKLCEYCHCEFIPDKPKRRYCSSVCRQKARSAKIRNQISYRTFRKMLTRAFPNWKCPFCDWTMSYDVHHVDGRSDSHLDKLVMLCPNHHSSAHLKKITKEELLQHAIGKTITLQELLDKFYCGKNTEFNFIRYDGPSVQATKETIRLSVVSDRTLANPH